MGCRQLQLNNYFTFIEPEDNPQNGFRFVGNDNAESVFPVRQNKFKFIEEEFSGEQFDPNIQMQYLRARYYDQSNGRFNRLDPFSGNNYDPQSLHKYAYTHCNPVMGIDPSGLMTLFQQMMVTGGLGLLIGLTLGFITAGKKTGLDKFNYVMICAASGAILGLGIPVLSANISVVLVKLSFTGAIFLPLSQFLFTTIAVYLYALMVNYGAFYLTNGKFPETKQEIQSVCIAAGGTALFSGLGQFLGGPTQGFELSANVILTGIGILWDIIIAPIWSVWGEKSDRYKNMEEFVKDKKSLESIIEN